MKRISYAGESFITTDRIADALLDLVAALGVNRTSATIEVPAYDGGSFVETVKLVAGPSSEIVCRSNGVEPVPSGEPENFEALKRLTDSTRALSTTRGVIYAHPHGGSTFDFEGIEGFESL